MSRTLADFRMDRKLLLLINQQWTNSTLDRFMAVLSSFDLWGPILLLTALILLWRGGFSVRAAILVAAAAAGICDGLVCSPLKQVIARPRPHQSQPGIRKVDLAKAKPRLLALGKPVKIAFSKPEAPTKGRSFPSSHTANTTTVAVVVALFAGGWAWAGCLVPVLVGYSRIYGGSHWPSDVAGSLVIGALAALLCTLAAAAVWRRQAPRWLPRLAATHPELLTA
jgi:undecaprenyl-diphosphatase